MDVMALIIAVVLILVLMRGSYPLSPRRSSSSRMYLRLYLRCIFNSWLLLGVVGIIVVHDLTLFGFSIPFVWAAIFSLILFSLCHLYQGWGGALGVGFLGITQALLYALTGNLFASMLWHMLFDVRFSFGTPTIEPVTQP